MSVENTLNERGKRYGKFIEHAEIAQSLQAVLHKMPNWPTLDYDMRQALVVITDKIARIGNGDPYYSDNWHDIAGYSTLVDKRLIELEQQDKHVALFEDAVMPEVSPQNLQEVFEHFEEMAIADGASFKRPEGSTQELEHPGQLYDLNHPSIPSYADRLIDPNFSGYNVHDGYTYKNGSVVGGAGGSGYYD